MNVRGCAAIVTGAAMGMGAATARSLAAAGARVALIDVNADTLRQVAQEVGGVALECDVADAEQLEVAITKARIAHGIARILVNCAGIIQVSPTIGPHGPLKLSEFERIVRVNLVGTFNAIRLVAQDMLQAPPFEDGQRGVLINTSSVAATDPIENMAAYNAAKGGIASMTLGLAREFGDFGIRVVTIAPASIDTAMFNGFPARMIDEIIRTMPFPKRLAAAEQFGRLVLHICDIDHINGTSIRLDAAGRPPYKLAVGYKKDPL